MDWWHWRFCWAVNPTRKETWFSRGAWLASCLITGFPKGQWGVTALILPSEVLSKMPLPAGVSPWVPILAPKEAISCVGKMTSSPLIPLLWLVSWDGELGMCNTSPYCLTSWEASFRLKLSIFSRSFPGLNFALQRKGLQFQVGMSGRAIGEVLRANWDLLLAMLSSLTLLAIEQTFLSPALGLLCLCLHSFEA